MTKSTFFRAWYDLRHEIETDEQARKSAIARQKSANAAGFAARARAAKAQGKNAKG